MDREADLARIREGLTRGRAVLEEFTAGQVEHRWKEVSDPVTDRSSLYVDGDLESSQAGVRRQGNDMPMLLGENPDAPGRSWDGGIDDVAVFDQPLSADEVRTIYQRGLAGETMARILAPEIRIDFDDGRVPDATIGGTAEVRDADVVVLAIKPQLMKDILDPIKDDFKDDALVISIAAGITCQP